MFTGHEDASTKTSGSAEESKSLDDMSSLFLNKKFADVTFIVAGEKIYGHKAIIAAKSKGFEILFDTYAEEREITILNTSLESFRILLKYIYTGKINISSDNELVLQILILANKYILKDLTSSMVGKIKTTFDAKNVFYFLNTSNDNSLDELRDACYSFIDANALQVLGSGSFSYLTEKSLIQLLKRRDTFTPPEIEIFKSVAKWCEKNNNNLILECVRLDLLTVFEIVSIVWPTKLVNAEKLLEIILQISDPNSNKNVSYMDQNIASFQLGTKVISDVDMASLLAGHADAEKYFYRQLIDGKKGIIIRLNKKYCINHIRLRFSVDNDDKYYSYYIETSLDQTNWHKIVDYSKYPCRSIQNLYFDAEVSQYIKIVGTSSSDGTRFPLMSFEAFYKSKIPKIVNAVICPQENVATLENKAVVVAGKNCLLNGDYKKFSTHLIKENSSGLIVQLAQPYVISNMRLLLWDLKDCSYSYLVETSVDNIHWELAIDRRNEERRSWQDLHFSERIVVFIKIIGTGCSLGNWFRCIHLECPSQSRE